MREIKFRAWHKKQKRMFSAEQMSKDQLTLLPTGKFINVNGSSTALSVIINEMIPQQYTGLRDKNGVEIYEGDIIKINDNPTLTRQVIFKDGYFGTNFLHLDGYAEGIEIIGNIHENPELLEPHGK